MVLTYMQLNLSYCIRTENANVAWTKSITSITSTVVSAETRLSGLSSTIVHHGKEWGLVSWLSRSLYYGQGGGACILATGDHGQGVMAYPGVFTDCPTPPRKEKGNRRGRTKDTGIIR